MKYSIFFRGDECLSRVRFARMSCAFLVFSCFLVCKISPSRYERRGDFSIEDGSDWDAQTRWTKLDIVVPICVNEGYTLYQVA